MLHDSTQRLILKLVEMTERGEIAWREASRDDTETSLYETEGYAVEVKAEPPGLRILRADGREVERADAAELHASDWPLGGGTFATHVKAMAVRARRVARGAEAAIASILSALASPPRNIATATTEPAGFQPAGAKAAAGLVAQAIPVGERPGNEPGAAARAGPSFGAIGSFAQTPQAVSPSGQHSAKTAAASADVYKPWV